MKDNLKKTGGGSLKCRTCKGPHYTAKCPLKDILAGADDIGTFSNL